mmetsp:Transcript_26640/g.58534  ORF Transcript_26640/g.58534 Transcript_26640/m.58534 type:complete len:267 (-) Transcript_26640:242-1042(-)
MRVVVRTSLAVGMASGQRHSALHEIPRGREGVPGNDSILFRSAVNDPRLRERTTLAVRGQRGLRAVSASARIRLVHKAEAVVGVSDCSWPSIVPVDGLASVVASVGQLVAPLVLLGVLHDTARKKHVLRRLIAAHLLPETNEVWSSSVRTQRVAPDPRPSKRFPRGALILGLAHRVEVFCDAKLLASAEDLGHALARLGLHAVAITGMRYLELLQANVHRHLACLCAPSVKSLPGPIRWRGHRRFNYHILVEALPNLQGLVSLAQA